MRWPLLAAAVMAAALLLGGCREADSDPFETRPLTPELQEMLDEIAALRGLEPPPALQAGTVSRLDVASLLDRQLTATDREWFATTTTLYRLLGHFGPDEDYLSVFRAFGQGAIIGLYSPNENRLWVVQREPLIDLAAMSPTERSALAHELVHAIQDYNFPLDELSERTAAGLDWGMAATTVIEGDAVTHQGLWDGRQMALPGGARLFLSAAGATATPPSIERELRFPYFTGAEWVNIVRSQDGTAAIDRYLAGEPLSTAHILHPELRTAGWQPEAVTLPDLRAALGAGWERESGGTFGEFHLRNYLELRLTALPAVTAAGGWRGDRYDVYVTGEDSVAVFRVRFADDSEAEEFASAQRDLLTAAGGTLAGSPTGTVAELRDGRTTIQLASPNPAEVLFVVGSSREVAERAATALANA